MPQIKVLADTVANQIAAGEVIERPVSVVRELVDNALDSGATEISVEIEEGGQSLVRVSDNGCGMNAEDAVLAFRRHATSKLHELGDLDSLASLGFRGEALPSIASVSRVRLVTRTGDAELGNEVLVEGGVLSPVKVLSAQPGTVLEVRNLFYNTPARKKFLKSPRSDETKIKAWLRHSALARPAVRYRLFADGKELLNLPIRENLFERAGTVFKTALIPFEASIGPLKVLGAIAHPSQAQYDSAALVTLVNGRLVTDRMLLKAVKDGFDSTLKPGEFPLGVIAITLPGAFVDVNVHPQKAEVRFRESGAVFSAVYQSVLQAVRSFGASSPAGPGSTPGRQYSSVPAASEIGLRSSQGAYAGAQGSFYSTSAVGQFAAESGEVHTQRDESRCEDSIRFADLRYIGQTLECYLLCEHADSLYIVDMHAAHERINYNLLQNRLKKGGIQSQRLLMPVDVTLPETAAVNCEDHADLLSQAGFELERTGEQGIRVLAVPALIAGCDVNRLVREIAAAEMPDLAAGRLREALDHALARIACHASVRSGQSLGREEVQALFETLDNHEFSGACPHGRPVLARFARSEVERWFGRDR